MRVAKKKKGIHLSRTILIGAVILYGGARFVLSNRAYATHLADTVHAITA